MYIKIPVRRLTRLFPTVMQAGGRHKLSWRCGKALARLWSGGIDCTIVNRLADREFRGSTNEGESHDRHACPLAAR